MQRRLTAIALSLVLGEAGCEALRYDGKSGGGGTGPMPDLPDDSIPDHPDYTGDARWEAWLCLGLATKVNRFAIAGDGGILVAGRVCGVPSDDCTAYLSRISPDGEVEWVTESEGLPSELPMGILVLADGRMAVVGNTCPDSYTCQPWVRRYAADGSPIQTHWHPGSHEVTDMAPLGDGMVLSLLHCPAGEACEGLVRGTDWTGATQWELGAGIVRELAVGPEDDLWLLEEAAGDPDKYTNDPLPPIQPQDLLVRRTSSAGEVTWETRIDQSGYDRGRRIEVTPNGESVVLGLHGPGSGTIWDVDQGGVHWLDADGERLWAIPLGGLDGPSPTMRDLLVTPDDEIVVLWAQDDLDDPSVRWRWLTRDGALMDERTFRAPEVTAGALGLLPGGDLLVGASVLERGSKLARIARYVPRSTAVPAPRR